MDSGRGIAVRTLVAAALIVVPGCGWGEGLVRPTTSTSAPPPSALVPIPSPGHRSAGPTPTRTPSHDRPSGALELRVDGLGDRSFGVPMVKVVPELIAHLGEPQGDVRMHGDMPYGWGGEDTTVRLLDFGGLQVVFDDWEAYFRDDGVMHLIAWGAEQRRTSTGVKLVTPDAIMVGSSVRDLVRAFRGSLHLPDVDQEGCAGPPWYFAVHPEEPWGLIGSLSGPPAEPGTHVDALSAGAPSEGWIPCWEP